VEAFYAQCAGEEITFCNIKRPNPWRRFADTPNASQLWPPNGILAPPLRDVAAQSSASIMATATSAVSVRGQVTSRHGSYGDRSPTIKHGRMSVKSLEQDRRDRGRPAFVIAQTVVVLYPQVFDPTLGHPTFPVDYGGAKFTHHSPNLDRRLQEFRRRHRWLVICSPKTGPRNMLESSYKWADHHASQPVFGGADYSPVAPGRVMIQARSTAYPVSYARRHP
jgi:hypothetical protein